MQTTAPQAQKRCCFMGIPPYVTNPIEFLYFIILLAAANHCLKKTPLKGLKTLWLAIANPYFLYYHKNPRSASNNCHFPAIPSCAYLC